MLEKNIVIRELLEAIEEEIRCGPDADQLTRNELSVPGDDLVSLAGQVALCQDEEALRWCRQQLWPRLREKVGDPRHFIAGLSFSMATDLTNNLCIPLEYAAAAHSLPKPEMDFSADFDDVGDNLDSEVISLLATRLDTGYLLAGLEELWSEIQSRGLAKEVWNTSGLREWDEELKNSMKALVPYAGEVRQMLAEVPTRLDEERFGVLLDIARSDYRAK